MTHLLDSDSDDVPFAAGTAAGAVNSGSDDDVVVVTHDGEHEFDVSCGCAPCTATAKKAIVDTIYTLEFVNNLRATNSVPAITREEIDNDAVLALIASRAPNVRAVGASANAAAGSNMTGAVASLNEEVKAKDCKIRALERQLEAATSRANKLAVELANLRKMHNDMQRLIGADVSLDSERSFPEQSSTQFSAWPKAHFDHLRASYATAMASKLPSETGIFVFPAPSPRVGGSIEAHTMPDVWVFLPHRHRVWAADKRCPAVGCANNLTPKCVHHIIRPLYCPDRVVWLITQDYHCVQSVHRAGKAASSHHIIAGTDDKILGKGIKVPWVRSSEQGQFWLHLSTVQLMHQMYTSTSSSANDIIDVMRGMHQATLAAQWDAFASNLITCDYAAAHDAACVQACVRLPGREDGDAHRQGARRSSRPLHGPHPVGLRSAVDEHELRPRLLEQPLGADPHGAERAARAARALHAHRHEPAQVRGHHCVAARRVVRVLRRTLHQAA